VSISSDSVNRHYYAPADAALGWIGVVDSATGQELSSISYTAGAAAFGYTGRPQVGVVGVNAASPTRLYLLDQVTSSVLTLDVNTTWLSQWQLPQQYDPIASFVLSASGSRIALIDVRSVVYVHAMQGGAITTPVYTLSDLPFVSWEYLQPAFSSDLHLFLAVYSPSAHSSVVRRYDAMGQYVTSYAFIVGDQATEDHRAFSLAVTGADRMTLILDAHLICAMGPVNYTVQCYDMQAQGFQATPSTLAVGPNSNLLVAGSMAGSASNSLAVFSAATTPHESSGSSGLSTGSIVAIVVVLIVVLVGAAVAGLWWRRGRLANTARGQDGVGRKSEPLQSSSVDLFSKRFSAQSRYAGFE
jgi:hypothetical protein